MSVRLPKQVRARDGVSIIRPVRRWRVRHDGRGQQEADGVAEVVQDDGHPGGRGPLLGRKPGRGDGRRGGEHDDAGDAVQDGAYVTDPARKKLGN